MESLINKKDVKKNWKTFIKKEEFIDSLCFYKAIQNTAKSMMLRMIDFLFIDEIYQAFLELLEVNNNIDIMITSKSQETISLCKERVNYMICNKADNWWL